jgi:hypothetical protein
MSALPPKADVASVFHKYTPEFDAKLRLIFDFDDEPEIAQLCEKLWSRGRVTSLRV